MELAEEFGTPLFVYDEAHLRARCREAVEAWGDGVAYATKAFLCVAMARLAHEEGMCLDVSTGGELHVALAAGVPADRLVLHGNNKSERRAGPGPGGRGRAASSSTPSTRSTAWSGWSTSRPSRGPTDADRVARPCWPGSRRGSRSTPTSSSAPVRTTPSSGSGWPRVRPPRPSTGCGLDAAGVVEFVGIHAHIGSQVFALAPFVQAVEVLAEFFAPLGLPELVVGGGLGVAYVNGEEAPPMAQWAASVRAGLPPGRHPRLGPGHRRAGPVDRGRRRRSPSTGWAR